MQPADTVVLKFKPDHSKTRNSCSNKKKFKKQKTQTGKIVKKGQKLVTVNLRSIFFDRFLRFCLSVKKYAPFLPHFYKSIPALSGLLVIDKYFVQKFCV